jgi:hypothetical protein
MIFNEFMLCGFNYSHNSGLREGSSHGIFTESNNWYCKIHLNWLFLEYFIMMYILYSGKG